MYRNGFTVFSLYKIQSYFFRGDNAWKKLDLYGFIQFNPFLFAGNIITFILYLPNSVSLLNTHVFKLDSRFSNLRLIFFLKEPILNFAATFVN